MQAGKFSITQPLNELSVAVLELVCITTQGRQIITGVEMNNEK